MSLLDQGPETGTTPAKAISQPAISAAPGLWRRIAAHGSARAGVVILALVVVPVVFASRIAGHGPYEIEVGRRLSGPSLAFPLGTDELGRDVLSRMLYGGRSSLGAALVATLLTAAIGVPLGMLAGYFRGAVDMVISRVIDVLLCFPSFLLALAITGALGRGLHNIVLAVVLSSWAGFARLVRGSVLAEEEQAYVETARAMGSRHGRILVFHLLPNIIGPILVLIALDVGGMLLILSAFSFLGLGIMAPFPEWGSMLADARTYIDVAPHMILAPGAAIFLVVLGCNLVGDALRDVLDPKT